MSASLARPESDNGLDPRLTEPGAPTVDSRIADASLDPFADVSGTQHYVPRRATERAIAEMRAAIDAEVPALVTGPPGIGKTVVLRQLGLRLRPELRTIYLPYPRLDPGELCAWILASLGASPRDASPWLLDAYRAHCCERGEHVLVLLDDVAAMPSETTAWLEGQLTSEGGFLRFAGAACTPLPGTPLFPRTKPSEAALTEPMSRSESSDYLAARLARQRLSADERAWTPPVLAALHGMSGGIPRALNSAAFLFRWGCSLEAVASLVNGDQVEQGRADGLERSSQPRSERVATAPSVQARARRRLRLR